MPEIVTWKIRVTSPDCQNEETHQFLQGMMDRMGVSYHKYGSLFEKVPRERTGHENVLLRVDAYLKTGNTEYLMDGANYCLIEHLAPALPNAHFRSTDSDESPGVIYRDGRIQHQGRGWHA